MLFFCLVSNLEAPKFDGFDEFAAKRPQINHVNVFGPGSTYLFERYG